jgi:hypothetical protein
LDTNGLTWHSLWNDFMMILIHISCYRPELCLQYKHEALVLVPPKSFTITTVSTVTFSSDEPIMHNVAMLQTCVPGVDQRVSVVLCCCFRLCGSHAESCKSWLYTPPTFKGHS